MGAGRTAYSVTDAIKELRREPILGADEVESLQRLEENSERIEEVWKSICTKVEKHRGSRPERTLAIGFILFVLNSKSKASSQSEWTKQLSAVMRKYRR
jgi:hypothetical protein